MAQPGAGVDSVDVTLPGTHGGGGALRVKVPRRKTDDVWIRSDAIGFFLSWLENADLLERMRKAANT